MSRYIFFPTLSPSQTSGPPFSSLPSRDSAFFPSPRFCGRLTPERLVVRLLLCSTLESSSFLLPFPPPGFFRSLLPLQPPRGIPVADKTPSYSPPSLYGLTLRFPPCSFVASVRTHAISILPTDFQSGHLGDLFILCPYVPLLALCSIGVFSLVLLPPEPGFFFDFEIFPRIINPETGFFSSRRRLTRFFPHSIQVLFLSELEGPSPPLTEFCWVGCDMWIL